MEIKARPVPKFGERRPNATGCVQFLHYPIFL